jgi:hypothetical protein
MSDSDKKIASLEKRVAQLETALEASKKPQRKKRSTGPSVFALFVKEKMPQLVKDFPDLKQSERMAKCAELWRAQKE